MRSRNIALLVAALMIGTSAEAWITIRTSRSTLGIRALPASFVSAVSADSGLLINRRGDHLYPVLPPR
jgi:hypothetical protein